jgi:hypothetical protein
MLLISNLSYDLLQLQRQMYMYMYLEWSKNDSPVVCDLIYIILRQA